MNKKQLIALHSWVGLKLSALMFVVCFTGTLAVFSYEIDWLIDSDMRVSTPVDTAVNWDKMAVSARETYPQRQLFFIAAPMYENFASVALTIDPELGARRTLLNPYTGDVIADQDWYASAQRILRDLHRYLLSPVGGIYLVGPFAIVLLISVITALLFYRKWWRGFFKLRLDKGSRAFWGSFHKVSGLWSLWFILLIAITGVWYLVEAFLADINVDIQFDRPTVADEQLLERDASEQMLPPSQAITIAKQHIENFEITNITMPRNQSTPYYVVGQTDALLVRDRSNHVFIDPVTGDVLRVQKTADQTAFERWIDMADPLHFGTFGGSGVSGLIVKSIWFVFGLAMCGLTATGIVIFIKRINNRRDTSKTSAVLGSFKYVTLLILLIPLTVGTLKVMDAYGAFDRPVADKFITLSGAPFDVDLAVASHNGSLLVRYSVQCTACLTKIEAAELIMKDGQTYRFGSLEDGFKSAQTVKLNEHTEQDIKGIRLTLASGDDVFLK